MRKRSGVAAAVASLAAVFIVVAGSMSASGAPAPGAEIVVGSQSGTDYADKLDTALSLWAGDPVGAKRAIVLNPNATIDLSQRDAAPGLPYQLQDGMHFVCLDNVGQESRINCKVRVQGGNALFKLKDGSNVRTQWLAFKGIEWDGSAATHFIQPSYDTNGVLAYSDFTDIGWSGFNTIMQVRDLGIRLTRFYINNVDHTPIRWGGSDSMIADGFIDSPNLDDTEYLMLMEHQSHTEVRKVFATCDGPTCVRVNGGFGGLQFIGGDYEAQGDPRGTAGAAFLLNGGFTDLLNVSTQDTNCDVTSTGRNDRGRITQNGGVSRIMNLGVGNRTTGCPTPPADLVDVQINGGKSLVYYGLKQNSGDDITIRKLTSSVIVRSDLPVLVG